MSASARERLGFGLLFLLALALRVVAALQYGAEHPQADHPVIDERAYEEWALEIAGGDWLGDEVFFQEPLYPYALGALFAAVGHDRLAARLVQAALGALTAVLVARLGRRLFGPAAGWVAGALVALHRPSVLMCCLLLKPNLFLPLFAGLALLLTRAGPGRPGRWLAVGALAGLGALLRGNLLVLTPLLVVWPLGHAWLAHGAPRPALARAAATLCGVLLVLLPVALRNQAVGGVFALTTSGAGTNLYGGNSVHNPRGVATEFPWVRGTPEHEADDWRREAERRAGRPLDPGEVSAFWIAELGRSLAARPAAHAAILWSKLRLTLGAHEVPDNHHLEWDVRYVAVLRAPLPGFGLLGTLGLAGLFVWLAARVRAGGLRRPEARAGLDLAMLFAAYLATIVLTVTSMRARLPLIVPLAPFAGAWCAGLARALGRGARAGRAADLALHGLALAAAAPAVLVPAVGAAEREAELLGRDHNLAVQLLQQEGELERGAALARELVERDPQNPRFQTLLASAEWRAGQGARAAGDEAGGRALVRSALGRAERVVREGLANPRERARASRLAGWIQQELGDRAAAERHFRRAREFASDDPSFVFDHLQALVRLAEAEPPGDARARARAEAAALLPLLADEAGYAPALADFAARLEALR